MAIHISVTHFGWLFYPPSLHYVKFDRQQIARFFIKLVRIYPPKLQHVKQNRNFHEVQLATDVVIPEHQKTLAQLQRRSIQKISFPVTTKNFLQHCSINFKWIFVDQLAQQNSVFRLRIKQAKKLFQIGCPSNCNSTRNQYFNLFKLVKCRHQCKNKITKLSHPDIKLRKTKKVEFGYKQAVDSRVKYRFHAKEDQLLQFYRYFY